MYSIELSQNYIELHIFGEFVVADYKAFEDLSRFPHPLSQPVNVLLDLSKVEASTIDVLIEQIKDIHGGQHPYGAVAIVSADQLVIWDALIAQFFIDAELCVFDNEDEARAWLDSKAQASDEALPAA